MAPANPSYPEAICEALVCDIANDNIPTLPRTEKQVALGIPSHLVFLCGLAVGSPAKDAWTAEQVACFRRLQDLHHEYSRQDHKASASNQQRTYQLSPTVIPSAKAQEIIQNAVSKKTEQLEEHAAAVAKELLDSASPVKSVKPKNHEKKKALQKRLIRPTSSKEEYAPAASADTETLEQVLATIQPVVHCRETAEGSWVEVKRNKRQAETTGSDENHHHQDEDDDHAWKAQPATSQFDESENQVMEPPVLLRETSKPPAVELPQEQSLERSPDAAKAVPSLPHPAEDTCSATPDNNAHHREASTNTISDKSADDGTFIDNNDDTATNVALHERIRKLEAELVEKDRVLEETVASHQRNMQAAKESFDERLQALQLRLYISDTKLKTFQDALDEHVQAVANNVVSTTTVAHGGSPLFRR